MVMILSTSNLFSPKHEIDPHQTKTEGIRTRPFSAFHHLGPNPSKQRHAEVEDKHDLEDKYDLEDHQP